MVDPTETNRQTDSQTRRRLTTAGTILGIGIGGFVDGILFHQILQLHSMLSARLPIRQTAENGLSDRQLAVNLEVNMFWDGLFHALTWTATIIGITLLYRALSHAAPIAAGRTLLGAILFGFGLFNLVEGILDHHILHLHHVIEAPGHLLYDVLFLISGVVLIVIGRWLIRADRKHRADPKTPKGQHSV